MKDFTGNYKIGTLITDVQNLKPGNLYILYVKDGLFLIRITTLEWRSEEHQNIYEAGYKIVDANNTLAVIDFEYSISNYIEGSSVLDYRVWSLETDVPVTNDLPVVAGQMFETIRSWCDLWDTIEEWVGNGPEWYKGEYLQLVSMVDRKNYMRLEFGDRVNKDVKYKNVPDKAPSFNEWYADEK